MSVYVIARSERDLETASSAVNCRGIVVAWNEYDTNHGFEMVNLVSANGASIIGPGPVVVGDMLYVNSGYGACGGRPGNVLLAFGVEP